jgi:hypothetical protein
MENQMLRVLGAGVMLLTLASTVAASEHYVEIWNPPEARLLKPVVKSKARQGKPALIARVLPKAGARRVADPLAKAVPVKHAGSGSTRKTVSPNAIDIPRIMTPEGNVLRVGGGNMKASVVR